MRVKVKSVKESHQIHQNQMKKLTRKWTMYEEKINKVDDIIDDLRGNVYTNLQYRIWAETIVGGRHDSLENPPKGSFLRILHTMAHQ